MEEEKKPEEETKEFEEKEFEETPTEEKKSEEEGEPLEEKPVEEPKAEEKEEKHKEEHKKEHKEAEKKEEHKPHKTHKHVVHHTPKKYPFTGTHVVLAIIILVLAISVIKTQSLLNLCTPAAEEVEAPVAAVPETPEVTVTHLTVDCEDCVDLMLFITQLNQMGINTKVNEVDTADIEGKELLEEYEIDKLPTLLFSEELGEYTDISVNWEQVGTIEDDGTYVLRTVAPPYLDLETGKVKGLVTLTYITDESCEDCYDVELHKTVLEGYGIKIQDESTVDISSDEGQELLEEYNITKVPTILLSEEADAYQGFGTVWLTVGEVAEDGTYVFRNVEVMGETYKDLETGELVEASETI